MSRSSCFAFLSFFQRINAFITRIANEENCGFSLWDSKTIFYYKLLESKQSHNKQLARSNAHWNRKQIVCGNRTVIWQRFSFCCTWSWRKWNNQVFLMSRIFCNCHLQTFTYLALCKIPCMVKHLTKKKNWRIYWIKTGIVLLCWNKKFAVFTGRLNAPRFWHWIFRENVHVVNKKNPVTMNKHLQY